MVLNERIREAYLNQANICSNAMLAYFFGTTNGELIEQQLLNDNLEVMENRYTQAVLYRIVSFTRVLNNVMNLFPGLDHDVPLLTEQYSKGFVSGFIRRIINYCEKNNIEYTYENKELYVEDYLLTRNNVLFYNVFDIENIVLELKQEKEDALKR